MRSFSYTPDASFSEDRVSLTILRLCLLRSFSYTPDDSFGEEFLLHSSGYV